MENALTLGKLLSLWFCFLLHSILFLISQTSYRKYFQAMSSLAPCNGNLFLVNNQARANAGWGGEVTILLTSLRGIL